MRRTVKAATPNETESPAIVMKRADSMIGWPERACCCAAQPVIKVLLPILRDDRMHIVDLYLCGHHYRESFASLVAARATTISRPRIPAFC
jgi:hypothetical protein